MYDILKAIAKANKWEFVYARKDYQNLFNEVEDKEKIHIFLDPVVVDDIENESGEIEGYVYSGRFLACLSSDYDEPDYDTRYEKYIKKVNEKINSTLKNTISCDSDLKVNQWRKIEAINILNYNFDGILVTYNITQEV